MPEGPTRLSAIGIDLSPRVAETATVVASPAAAAETIIASLTLNQDPVFGLGVVLLGYAAYTVGTTGTAATVRIRRTNVAGTIVKASGAMTRTAAQLWADSIIAVDTGPTFPGQIYVVTLQVTAATAASTVSAVELVAIVV